MDGEQVQILRVIDGDTIEVMTGSKLFRKPHRERIRLYGMDAPESSQTGGKESTSHLSRLIGTNPKIWLVRMDTDQYGRTVGLIHRRKTHPEESYNYMMVRDGQARCYMTGTQDRKRFQDAEDEAKQRGWGIWNKKNATAPWEYRKDQRRRSQRRSRAKLILLIVAAAITAAAAAYIRLGLPTPSLP